MNADYVWKLSKFGRLTSTRLRFDDDFADRLNYQLTGLLLFVFVGIIGIRQYVGKFRQWMIDLHFWKPRSQPDVSGWSVSWDMLYSNEQSTTDVRKCELCPMN